MPSVVESVRLEYQPGSVVSRDVPDYGLVFGNPARLRGFVCPCGEKMVKEAVVDQSVTAACPEW